jgi:predicted ATPase/DNA-binding CsgD family transcriptional regulator
MILADDLSGPASYDRGMAGRTTSPIFIGRSSQLALAELVLDRVGEDDSGHLLISGEAGVGKTRFTRELTRLAIERSFRILRGGCVSLGGMGLPFAPISDALRDALVAGDRTTLEGLDPRIVHALTSLVPGLTGLASGGDVRGGAGAMGAFADDVSVDIQGSQAILFDSLVRLLRGLAAETPLLVVIEDLHWSDPATRDAITYLVPSLTGERIVLCLTYRTDELDRRHPLLPWLAEIGRTGAFERIDLERFDREDTARIVAAIRGEELDPAKLARLHERTDGNAFFLEEVLLAGASGSARGGLPPTIMATLVARIAAAPPNVQRVLRVAAVAGRRVDHELLAEVAGQSEDELTDALRGALDRQLLVMDSDRASAGYAFRHALVQEAAYDDLLPGERRSLHRACALALARRPAPAGAAGAAHWAELAHHWAAARDDVEAARSAIRAGDTAFEALAFADAQRQFEVVLELWDSVPEPEVTLGIDKLELLGRAAAAAEIDGQFLRMSEFLREAVDLQDAGSNPIGGALLRAQLGRALWLYDSGEESLVQYAAAMDLLPADEPTAERARVVAGMGQILMLIDEYEASIAHCQEAVRIARAVGDRQVEGHALNSLGIALACLGRCKEGVASLEASLDIALGIGSVEDIARSYVNLTDAMRFCHLDTAALDAVERGIAEIERFGATGSYGPVIRENGVLIQYRLGNWDAAARWEAESRRMVRPGRNPPLYHLSTSMGLVVGRGDADAEAVLDRFAELLEGQPVEAQYNGMYTLARAEHELWRNRPVEAAAEIEAGLALLEQHPFAQYLVRVHAMGARARADLAEIARMEREPGRIEAAIVRIDGHVQRIGELIEAQAPEPESRLELVGSLRTAEAERTRAAGPSDPAAWQAAVEVWVERGRPYEAAYGRWRLAEARLGVGDRVAARDALAAAHAWATEQGARPLAAAAAGLARRSRIDLARTVPSLVVEASGKPDPFGLTARERDVLELVAIGLTNRQIAERLFISENTAGVHVSNIIGKLGATGRTEVAAIAVRLDLVAVPAEP